MPAAGDAPATGAFNLCQIWFLSQTPGPPNANVEFDLGETHVQWDESNLPWAGSNAVVFVANATATPTITPHALGDAHAHRDAHADRDPNAGATQTPPSRQRPLSP